MMKQVVRAACIAAVLSLSVLTTQARAATISLLADTNNQTFDIFWSLLSGSTLMQAEGNFEADVSDTGIDFTVTMTNNTSSSFNQRVHSFGFDIDPNATSASMTTAGTTFQNIGLNDNFPSFKTIDVCVWATQNCAGGAQGSNLAEGASDTFSFHLAGNFSSGATLSGFAIKFQGDLGSFEFGDTTPPNGNPPPPVPEPASALLLGLGFAASMAGARRRNR